MNKKQNGLRLFWCMRADKETSVSVNYVVDFSINSGMAILRNFFFSLEAAASRCEVFMLVLSLSNSSPGTWNGEKLYWQKCWEPVFTCKLWYPKKTNTLSVADKFWIVNSVGHWRTCQVFITVFSCWLLFSLFFHLNIIFYIWDVAKIFMFCNLSRVSWNLYFFFLSLHTKFCQFWALMVIFSSILCFNCLVFIVLLVEHVFLIPDKH